MITEQNILEILSVYKKFGWQLRRVLLSPKVKKELDEAGDRIFENVQIIESNIDAVWFSRPSSDNREAWELRRLSQTPYALFESFDKDADPELCEQIRHEMELKLH